MFGRVLMSIAQTSRTSAPTSAAALESGFETTEQALACFDALEPVDVSFMLGTWRGSGVDTHHPMDGVLERAGWSGKRFETAEEVHPLVHVTRDERKFCVQPLLMPIGLLVRHPWLRNLVSRRLFLLLRPLFSTRHPAARLRMTEYRGVVSATMIYDRQPINDVFRKIDEDMVLGVMDMRGMARPFFFKLSRERIPRH